MSGGPVALALLASGMSMRFGGDKLMSALHGRPVLSFAASSLVGRPVGARLAVVGVHQSARRALLAEAGWTLVDNPVPEAGQGAALARAAAAASALAQPAAMLLVTLADMPCVPDAHLEALIAACGSDVDAVVSKAGDLTGPPAAFSSRALSLLQTLTGDQGAKPLLAQLRTVRHVGIDARRLADVDTPEDLKRLNDAPLLDLRGG